MRLENEIMKCVDMREKIKVNDGGWYMQCKERDKDCKYYFQPFIAKEALRIAKLLIDNGADINAKNSSAYPRIFHVAANKCRSADKFPSS